MEAQAVLRPLALHQSEGEAFSPPISRLTSSDTTALISMFERIVLNPEISIERMLAVMDMQKEILARNAKSAFAADFALMQPELPVITERGAITNRAGEVQSTYAKWEDINEAIKPVMAKYGFGLSFRIRQGDANVTVKGILSHRAGHEDDTEITLPVDMTGSKNGVQGVGSSTSYGKRYTASAVLNLTSRGEDDGGQAGGTSPMPTLVGTAVNAIDFCGTLAELKAWKEKNAELINNLPSDDATLIVRACNARAKKLREEIGQ